MNESKITDKTVALQYGEFDEASKYFTSAMLRLIAVMFQTPYQAQCVDKVGKQTAPDSQEVAKWSKQES
ncbi:MAG: hypothetical protein K2J71_01205 [Oscillospiraceae bacterium]|nr:hypothetical protein [Oscillospiraceae bacterium]MDE6729379.1 hypothetical protein [Oscillospiraceae bacterium]